MNTYITKQGDTWDGIAYNELGSVSYTDKLMRVNTPYLRYYTFPAGIVLNLPALYDSQNIGNLPAWKQVSG